jgi:Holliday junction resolvase RusA-like endonuclease
VNAIQQLAPRVGVDQAVAEYVRHICAGGLVIRLDYPHQVVPYVRVGQERWTQRATRYLASKDALALHLRLATPNAYSARIAFPDGANHWGVRLTVRRRTRRAYDLDNVVKAVFDGLNGVLWRDDVLVVDLRVRKRYAATPCVRVEVWELAEPVQQELAA